MVSKFPFKLSAASVMLLLILYLQGGSVSHFILLLAALAFHELSHLLAVNLFGYQINELKLTPFGGCLTVDPLFETNPEAEFFISISGPLMNWVMVGGVAYLKLLGIENQFLISWQLYNFLLGFINLIPAYPLDGGRIFHAWMVKSFGLIPAALWSKVTSFVSAVGFLGFAVSKMLRKEGGSFYLLLGLFILCHFFWIAKPRLAIYWRLLQRKKSLLAQKGHLPLRNVMVTPQTLLKDVLLKYASEEYLQFNVCESGGSLGTVSEDLAWETLLKDGFKATFMETMKRRNSVSLQIVER